jgi:hypothetical protein
MAGKAEDADPLDFARAALEAALRYPVTLPDAGPS